MKPTLVAPYATEGAPLLIAALQSASHWRGQQDDGSGVIVEFMGQQVETLPRELRQTARPGRQRRKFANLEEARAFQAKLLAALQELHPRAARHPRFPDQSAYYLGAERVYSVELEFTSMLDTLLEALERDVQVVVFDRKRKAQAVVMQQGGGGRGLIVADPQAAALVVAKFHHHAPEDQGAAVKSLRRARCARAQAKIPLDGWVLVFDSTQSERDIASANWQRQSLAEALDSASPRGNGGPLRIPGQQAPGGAFVRLPAGEYALSWKDDADVGGGARVVWLTRRHSSSGR
jgi:hypothetical protein